MRIVTAVAVVSGWEMSSNESSQQTFSFSFSFSLLLFPRPLIGMDVFRCACVTQNPRSPKHHESETASESGADEDVVARRSVNQVARVIRDGDVATLEIRKDVLAKVAAVVAEDVVLLGVVVALHDPLPLVTRHLERRDAVHLLKARRRSGNGSGREVVRKGLDGIEGRCARDARVGGEGKQVEGEAVTQSVCRTFIGAEIDTVPSVVVV